MISIEEPAVVTTVDPLEHPDWDARLEVFPGATIFHGRNWAMVLHDTYGHKAVYIAQFQGERLTGLLPVMEVSHWATGRRGVALPFTDFCPALGDEQTRASLYQTVTDKGRQRGWKYLECRALDRAWQGATASVGFYEHTIDLSLEVDRLFEGLEGAMRRGVRKAQEAGLKVEFGTEPEHIRAFYRLHCQTRRRHGAPPQPIRFFDNIQRHLLAAGQGFVVLVSRDKQPLAAGVFFYQGHHAVYKFGASDLHFQHLRPNNLMMWAGIQKCAEEGMETLSLGRTSLSNEGLRRFKVGLGAVENIVEYARYDFGKDRFVKTTDKAHGWHNWLFSRTPAPLLRFAGGLLYPALS